MSKLDKLPYRPCVGIMLTDGRGRVFVGRRLDTPDAWQMPQGGIDDGESPRQAAMRELGEEIGTSAAEIIGETEGWLRYDLPEHLIGKVWKGKYRGQKQKWYAFRFTGKETEIDVENPAGGAHKPEFIEWRWEPIKNLPNLIIPFKRDVYERVVKEFAPLAK
jgi:putative (di)nucleoside polyphosphate hydrolase